MKEIKKLKSSDSLKQGLDMIMDKAESELQNKLEDLATDEIKSIITNVFNKARSRLLPKRPNQALNR